MSYTEVQSRFERANTLATDSGEVVEKARALVASLEREVTNPDDARAWARVTDARDALARAEVCEKNANLLVDEVRAELERAEMEHKREELAAARVTASTWRDEVHPSLDRIVTLAGEIKNIVSGIITQKMANANATHVRATELAAEFGQAPPSSPAPQLEQARALLVNALFEAGFGPSLGKWIAVPLTEGEVCSLLVSAFEADGYRSIDGLSDGERIEKLVDGSYFAHLETIKAVAADRQKFFEAERARQAEPKPRPRSGILRVG